LTKPLTGKERERLEYNLAWRDQSVPEMIVRGGISGGDSAN